MSKRDELINGKHYSMWAGLVDAKERLIGGTLTDNSEHTELTTKLLDLTLEPQEPDSAVFTMHGEDFDCAVNVKYGGVTANPDGGFIVHGYQLSFTLRPPAKAEHANDMQKVGGA